MRPSDVQKGGESGGQSTQRTRYWVLAFGTRSDPKATSARPRTVLVDRGEAFFARPHIHVPVVGRNSRPCCGGSDCSAMT